MDINNMWKQTEINLGELKSQERKKVSFQYEGELKVQSIAASCGCTETEWKPDSNTLEVVYTPVPVPHHLKLDGKDFYNSRKTISVLSENNRTDILIFTALIKD